MRYHSETNFAEHSSSFSKAFDYVLWNKWTSFRTLASRLNKNLFTLVRGEGLTIIKHPEQWEARGLTLIKHLEQWEARGLTIIKHLEQWVARGLTLIKHLEQWEARAKKIDTNRSAKPAERLRRPELRMHPDHAQRGSRFLNVSWSEQLTELTRGR